MTDEGWKLKFGFGVSKYPHEWVSKKLRNPICEPNQGSQPANPICDSKMVTSTVAVSILYRLVVVVVPLLPAEVEVELAV
nr:hypothetical protein CFP56_71523 [Quercus suber]